MTQNRELLTSNDRISWNVRISVSRAADFFHIFFSPLDHTHNIVIICCSCINKRSRMRCLDISLHDVIGATFLLRQHRRSLNLMRYIDVLLEKFQNYYLQDMSTFCILLRFPAISFNTRNCYNEAKQLYKIKERERDILD